MSDAAATRSPARRSRRNAMLAALVSLALIAAAVLGMKGARAEQPPPPPPPQVTVAAAVGREINDWDEFTGHLEAVDMVEIRPRVSGYVERVAFTEGSEVRRGQVLFVIDQRPYAAEVARAEAALEQARTRLELARSEAERAKRLVAVQAISREEYDTRVSASAQGDAELRAAEAALRTARLNLEWTTIRSPIDGRVGRAQVTRGNLVQAGVPTATPLTTVVSLDPIYMYFDGDEQTYLDRVGLAPRSVERSASAPAALRRVRMGLANEEGFPHEGTIDFVDNRLDPVAGTIRARAVFSNHDHSLTPGLFARIKLAGSRKYEATLVRDAAVGTDQDRKFVYVLKPDGSVDYRSITLGPLVDGLRAVKSGLKPGEMVVVNGLQRVRPGVKVAATRSPMILPDSALQDTVASR